MNIIDQIMQDRRQVWLSGHQPGYVLLGVKQTKEFEHWKETQMYSYLSDVDPTGERAETFQDLTVLHVNKFDFFAVTGLSPAHLKRAEKQRDDFQTALVAERAGHAVTTAALAEAMQTIDAMAAGQTDLLNLLMACAAQGEALPESLRLEITKLLGSAVVVIEEDTPLGAQAIARPLDDLGPFES